MPKVLISDALSPRAADILKAHGIEVDFLPGLPAADLEARIGEYEGLAVRSATKVTSGLLECAEKLKVIGRAGIGVDNIDVAAATQRGIVVMNTPYGNSITAAEHTIAMLFALCREIPVADRSTQGILLHVHHIHQSRQFMSALHGGQSWLAQRQIDPLSRDPGAPNDSSGHLQRTV